MAFHTEMPPYHGTAQDIRAFDPSLGGATSGSQAARLGVFAARDPDTASEFATYAAARGKGGSPDALPLLHRAERPAVLSLRGDELDREISATLDYAWDDGYDAVLLKNYTTPGGKTGKETIVVKSPEQLRSIFAKFDPKDKDSRDLLAGIFPIGVVGGDGFIGRRRVKFYPVSSDHIHLVWDQVAPKIKTVADRAGTYTVEDIATRLLKGTAQLWVALKGDRVVAACVAEINDYKRRECNILICAGSMRQD